MSAIRSSKLGFNFQRRASLSSEAFRDFISFRFCFMQRDTKSHNCSPDIKPGTGSKSLFSHTSWQPAAAIIASRLSLERMFILRKAPNRKSMFTASSCVISPQPQRNCGCVHWVFRNVRKKPLSSPNEKIPFKSVNTLAGYWVLSDKSMTFCSLLLVSAIKNNFQYLAFFVRQLV